MIQAFATVRKVLCRVVEEAGFFEMQQKKQSRGVAAYPSPKFSNSNSNSSLFTKATSDGRKTLLSASLCGSVLCADIPVQDGCPDVKSSAGIHQLARGDVRLREVSV
jgi:hypothetical protein